MTTLPCGKERIDCSECAELECTAEDKSFREATQRDAMNRLALGYGCISECEEKLAEERLLSETNIPDEYYWPWPVQPGELRAHLDALIDRACTEKQARIVRLRHKWDSHREVQATFTDIGVSLGVSKQGIRELYYAGLHSIKQAMYTDLTWSSFEGDLEELLNA